MAHAPNPYDPYRFPNDPVRSGPGGDEANRPAGLDDDLQIDPDLAAGPAGGAKLAMFAIALAVALGAIFYGLNNTSVHQTGTSTTAQNAPETSPPAPPPGMRDVTPRRANTDQGITTGAAPERPQMPPPTAPREMSRPGNPPATNAPGK